MSLFFFDSVAVDRIVQLRRLAGVTSESPLYTRLFYNKAGLLIEKAFDLLDFLPLVFLFIILIYLFFRLIKQHR